jgi:hypothetical protein
MKRARIPRTEKIKDSESKEEKGFGEQSSAGELSSSVFGE